MADWRQIQARIRKAKAGTDAAAKLAELYERTRDAMVAFELARWQEKAGEHAEAARWYTAAAERFRRSQWKSKAEAALARLRNPSSASSGSDLTEASAGAGSRSQISEPSAQPQDDLHAESADSQVKAHTAKTEDEVHPETGHAEDREPPQPEQVGETIASQETAEGEAPSDQPTRKRPRHRGRRGGRNRRRSTRRAGSESAAPTSPVQTPSAHLEAPSELPSRAPSSPAHASRESNTQLEPSAGVPERSGSGWRGRSRAGEPALASRMAHLESQLRRLLAAPQAKLEQAESAPAGPGVLLLSDAEQVTHYYVESCQTLRIAIGNLLRGARGSKEMPQLKERLAQNLGIAESRAMNYLKEHCAVRWLQLDEGASELAHFAVAVLRPAVND